jgi:serine protease Do
MFHFQNLIFFAVIGVGCLFAKDDDTSNKPDTSVVAEKEAATKDDSDSKASKTTGCQPSFEDVVDKVIGSVVSVTVHQQANESSQENDIAKKFEGTPFEDFFKNFSSGGKARKVVVSGSGFIIRVDKDCIYVVTNSHIVENYSKVKILIDKEEIPATVHGCDSRSDIAILKVNLQDIPEDKRNGIRALQWGDSDSAKVGQWVMAVGNPFGLGNTVTAGIISAKSRDLNLNSSSLNNEFIQHSAQINVGNSGGCLVNIDGDVIGINTVIITPSGGNVGIGFAIPSKYAKEVAEKLIANQKIKRGALGIKVQDFTPEMAQGLGVKYKGGAVVASVDPAGPASKARIQLGDVIVQFDGIEVTGMKNLSRIVSDAAVDSAHKVTVIRGGEEKVIDVKLGDFDNLNDTKEKGTSAKEDSSVVEILGMSLVDADGATSGAIVTNVAADSPADDVGISRGDVISEVNQKKVKSAQELKKEIVAAQKNKRKFVFLKVQRTDDVRFLSIRVDEEDSSKKSDPKEKGKGKDTEKQEEKEEKKGAGLAESFKDGISKFGGIIDGFFNTPRSHHKFFQE